MTYFFNVHFMSEMNYFCILIYFCDKLFAQSFYMNEMFSFLKNKIFVLT